MTENKKSAAAKKAAATRKANEEAKVAATNDQVQETEQVSAEEQAERDAAGSAREKQVRTPTKEPVPDYEPKRPPLENAGLDQHAAEEQRQAELQAQRDEHNARTMGWNH